MRKRWGYQQASGGRRPAPQTPTSQHIRYLAVEEVKALLRAVPDDELGATDRALDLVAATTGLRRRRTHRTTPGPNRQRGWWACRPSPPLAWQAMAEADTPSPTVEPLLSIEEVATVLRISKRSLYRLLSRGELEALKVGGRTLMEPDEVRRFIADQRRTRSNEESSHRG